MYVDRQTTLLSTIYSKFNGYKISIRYSTVPGAIVICIPVSPLLVVLAKLLQHQFPVSPVRGEPAPGTYIPTIKIQNKILRNDF